MTMTRSSVQHSKYQDIPLNPPNSNISDGSNYSSSSNGDDSLNTSHRHSRHGSMDSEPFHNFSKNSPEGQYTENLRRKLKELFYQNSDEDDRRDHIERAKNYVPPETIEKNLLG